MKSIIVGVDPGIIAGVSILDSRGNILVIHSKRDAKRSDIVKFITKFGRPVIIATDVNPSPRSVGKIASVLGSNLYVPKKSMTVKEKIKLVRNFAKELKNDHESDALAASLKAWKTHRILFDRVFIELKKKNKIELYDEIISKLVQRGSENISVTLTKTLLRKNLEWSNEKKKTKPE